MARTGTNSQPIEDNEVTTEDLPENGARSLRPQPLIQRRTLRSAHKRYGGRLHIDAVTLRQVVEFAVGLQSVDPTLRLTGLALINRSQETAA